MAFRHIGLALAFAFAMGCQGVAGPTGDPGASGPAGPQGAAGPSGAQGEPGPRGTPGADGEDGATGQDGADGQDGAEAATRGQLAGAVTDGDGDPLVDVVIQLPQRASRTQTDAEGRFAFADLPMGVYTLTAELEGYLPFRDVSVAVFPEQTTTLDLSLAPVVEGLITGQVLTTDARPVPGAQVFTDFGGHRATTDADGRFLMAVLPTAYAVSAWAPGTAFGTASAVQVRPDAGGQAEVELVLPIGSLEAATYVGSSACADCHAETYARWNRSVHAHSVRPIDLPGGQGAGPVLSAPWEGEVQLAAEGLPETTVRLLRAADGTPEFEVVGSDGSAERYPVSHSYGAGHGRFKQRYMVRIDGTLRVSPLQYNEATGEWVAYHLERWVDAQGALRTPDGQQTFEASCQGCHSTGLQLTPGADQVVRASYTELNTGCEACHGPASKHVLSPRGDNIINPRGLYPANTFGIIGMDGAVAQAEAWAGFQRAQETCGGCHVRGHSKAADGGQGQFGFPWVDARGPLGQLAVGEALADGFTPGDGVWDDTRYDRTPTSVKHHQQYTDELNAHLSGAAHGRNPFHLVACFDCHDPHGSPLDSQLRLPANDNTLCLDCHGPHGFEDEAAVIAHTRHPRHAPGTTGSGRCVGCHMPRTAKSAVNYDVRSHTFRVVVPHESAAQAAAGQPAMPNSCDVCHVDDEDQGSARYEVFFGAPEPVED